MHDLIIPVAGGFVFAIIAYRTIRMLLRIHRELRRQRLLEHLDWSGDSTVRHIPRI
ncbi:MAG: hypothetical protein AAGB18_05950 [Pseudomonadota bacterium]